MGSSAKRADDGTRLVAQDLVKSFRTAPTWQVWDRTRRLVVDRVSVEVGRNEVVGLLGPNGAGKTTTFNMLVGVLGPDGGRVSLGGADLTHLPMHRRARMGLGYLPQEASIFRKLSVRDNFLAILESLPLARAEREARAQALLDEFRLTHVAQSRGETLSGGERRRAEIARSLIRSPAFMLFDEPFAGIDPIAVTELKSLIGALKARGLGILITDHDVRNTLAICDRAYVIADGRILEEGPPASLAASALARKTYLGEGFRLDEAPLAGGAGAASGRKELG